MKKLLLSSALFLISFIGFSQTKGISYQAVIIDPNPIEIPGKDVTAQPYVSKDVWIRFGIYAGTTLQYEELHKTKTDEYGLVNLIIGDGVNTGKAGTFTSLSWDGITKSIITNVSFDQGGRYTEVSNQKLNYVPYTLLAETAVKLAGVLPIASGGTGATNAIAVRTNLGLGNVENTADADKPISIATLAILDTKEAIANKSTNIIADSASSVKYPSVKAIKDYVDSRTSSANNANLAAKAAALTTPRTINGVPFDGTADITIPVGVTPADADSSTKGILQLAGDLSGTAASPRIKNGAITNAKIMSVAGSKVTGDIAGNAATATLATTATSANTATKLTTARTINGTPFDGTSDITITTNASTLSGTIGILNGGTGASTAAGARTNLGLVIGTDVQAPLTAGTDYLTPSGNAANLTNFPILNQNTTGNAATATLAGNITASTNTSLTSLSNLSEVGTITSGVWSATTLGVSKGGTGVTSLTGYIKGNGVNNMNAVTSIPASDITGLIKKVNGTLPDQNGNVSISFGRVSSGDLNSKPSNGTGTNGDIYVVSGDATSTNNGRTFIYDGNVWNEITSNLAATDARYLQLAGGTLGGNLIIPTNNSITLTDLPNNGTDAVNKNYVDASVVGASIPDASSGTKGKLQLAGDLSGTAVSPTVATVGGSAAADINTATLLANGATNLNTRNTLVKRDASGNFSANLISANLVGNATSSTLAGNISATSNSTLTSLQNLATVGTITAGTWNGNTISVANGGTGATSLTGYLKGNGSSSFSAVNSIPASDITGLITKVNGITPDPSGNVSLSFGRVSSGILSSRPSNGTGTNGDFYVVSGDATSTNNGRTFIYDGSTWNEITSNVSATDARYLQLAGGTLNGNLVIPNTKKITLTDQPILGTDAANKNYVDASISSASSNATSTNTANATVKRDASGNFSASSISANLLGNATTATTAGNITATSNTTLTSLQNLNTVGTIATGVWNGTTIAVANGGTGSTNGSITGSSALSFTAGGTNQNVSLSPSGTGKIVLNGNVGIGTASPNSSAALDVSSTTQMFYPPRMTTAQRDLISSPSTGGVIYNTTLNKLQVYTAGSLSTDGTGYFGSSPVYDDPFQGQTIQPLSTGILNSIKASVSIRANSDNIQVKIYDAPNGNLLATSDATFYAPVGGTFNFVTGTWTFANSNLTLNANSTYYVEFNATGGNRFFIGYTNNSYSRGQLYKGSTHAGVTAMANYDLDFALSYGSPGAWDANVTATKLATSKNINGIAFDGSSDITIAAASNTLTGTTLASNVVNSSLTSVGVITSGTWSGSTIAVANGGTGTSTGSITGTSALTFSAGGTNQNVTLNPSGTGNVILNGNIGVGTNSPTSKLEIASGTSGTSGLKFTNLTNSSSAIQGNKFLSLDANGNVIYATTGVTLPLITANGTYSTTTEVRDYNTWATRGNGFYITDLGGPIANGIPNLGAYFTLSQVASGSGFFGQTSLNDLGFWYRGGATSSISSNTWFRTLSLNANSRFAAQWDNASNNTITLNNVDNGPLAFATNNVERMRISATGNVTLGGPLAVTGAGTFSSTLTAGATTLASSSITGNETIGGTLSVTGATTLSNLTVSGTSTLTGNVAIGNLGTYVSGDNLVLADANGNLHKRSITPVNTQASATSYTLTLGDNGGILTFASSSPITVTVPSTLPAGFVCQIIQKGTGQITVTGSGTTLNSANGVKSRAQYSAIGVVLETSTVGYITGDTTI